jgi:hypothetical protein
MHHNTINCIAQQMVLGLLYMVILKVIQLAIAFGNLVVAVMVAHGLAPS